MSRSALSRELAQRAYTELCEGFGLSISVDFGDDFFNALFYGTLKTFAERVDSSGFCQTSYGEMNGVKCYGHCHYPRDAAEASRILAMVGLHDKAERILDFTLRNIPDGQEYIPHVYNADGSVRANTIQVDTPGIVATALGKLVDLKGATDTLKWKYDRLAEILHKTWEDHYHNDEQLLDAGNYNEQFGGGNELICDIFTNSSFYAGLCSMRDMARAFEDEVSFDLFSERLELIASGIEKNLYDEAEGFYKPLSSSEGENAIDWHSLYCSRWYPMRPEASETAFRKLREKTVLKWDRWNVISCQPGQDHAILGKVFARLIGYLVSSGRVKELAEHLDFARNTITKPANVFPEWWYLRRESNPSEYWRGFWEKYGKIWQPYEENPNGDYTVDSGNCEQCAVFLSHVIEDILGVKTTQGNAVVAPVLSDCFDHLTVERFPVAGGWVSYRMKKQNSTITLDVVGQGESVRQILVQAFADEKVRVGYNAAELTSQQTQKLAETSQFAFTM